MVGREIGAIGTNVVTFSNPATSMTSSLRYLVGLQGGSRSLFLQAILWRTGGSGDGGAHCLAPDENFLLEGTIPCSCSLVWQNGAYPRKPGSLQRPSTILLGPLMVLLVPMQGKSC
jgi:hypothetical protein